MLEVPSRSPVVVVPDRDRVVVAVVDDLDLLTAGTLEAEVWWLLSLGFDHVVIDLRAVPFMDVAGLRALLNLSDVSRDGRRTLTLLPGPRAVQRVFEVTATHDRFTWGRRLATG